MTGIPSLIGSLKKTQAVVEELATSTQRELSATLNQITQLLELVDQLQEEWEERQATEEELTDEASSLEGELSAESEEQSRLESTDTTQQKELVEVKAEKETLQRKLASTEGKLEELEDGIRSIERSLKEVGKNMVKVDEKLGSSDEEFTEQLQTLKVHVSEAQSEAELQVAKYKALRYLIHEGIISMPEAKVAVELKGKETTTLDHLQKTTFIGRFKVRDIIEQMAERKIVKFDKETEQVKVLKPIDL
jgi:chromosome segregation ATPase